MRFSLSSHNISFPFQRFFLLPSQSFILTNNFSLSYNKMETSPDLTTIDPPTSSPSTSTGSAADILLWKRWHISFGVIVVATVAWVLLEWSELPFLTICSDVLLILIVLLFLHANYAALRNKQPPALPELVVSEEMVNNAAASLRVKINNVLLMAHDITLGKDFRIFFKVVVLLWLLSVIGSTISFFTLAYIGTLIAFIVPVLYGKYGAYLDKCCGMIHRQFSRHYRVVDESLFNRLPRNAPREKDS